MSRFLSGRLRACAPYVPGEQPKGQPLIKLNTNESPYPPSPLAMAAVTPEALQDLRLYCDIGAGDFCDAVAEAYGVAPDQVLPGNGSDEVLSFAFQAFGQGGVAFPDVSYGFYAVWAALYGLDATAVPVGDDFSIDPSDYFHRGRLVVIANPNAPTGLCLDLAAIRAIVEANRDSVVLIDEAYVDFGGQSAAALIAEYENLLVVQTFSKSRSLAGARLGFALGPRALIEDLNRVKFSINPYNVSSVTQVLGAAAMRDAAYFEDCRGKIVAAREYAKEALRALGFAVADSAANFLFAAPPPGLSGAAYQRELRARGILVRHFAQPRIDNRVRISVGTMAQMRALTQATKEVLRA